GVAQITQLVFANEMVRSAIAVEVASQVSVESRPLRADDDFLEPLACTQDESRTAILEPIRPVFVRERGEMKILPRRRARTIADGAQVFLVPIRIAGKRAVGINDGVAVSVGGSFEKPTEDPARHGILHTPGGRQSELQPCAIRQRAFPVSPAAPIADERAFVFAEEIARRLWDQLLLDLVDEHIAFVVLVHVAVAVII